MILGSSSDVELFPSPAFMVGTTVVGREEHTVDISGVDVGSGSVSYKLTTQNLPIRTFDENF